MYNIYVVTCGPPNRKQYVGVTTKDINERCVEHSKVKRGYKFPRAIRKYGKDNFTIELLDTTDSKKMANKLEEFYIKI